MKKLTTLAIFATCILLSSCETLPANYTPTKTSLEIESIQSREFKSTKKISFTSTLSVFQDLGYQITSSDLETGYISAKSPTHVEGWYGKRTMRDTKATAFIEELRQGYTKIRLSFVDSLERTGSGVYAATIKQDHPIEEINTYNNAFLKIQEAIFIRSATK